MFFRIWVLYANKVGLLALGVYLALFPFHGHSWVDRCALVALAVVVTICCTAQSLAVPIFIWPGKIRCPIMQPCRRADALSAKAIQPRQSCCQLLALWNRLCEKCPFFVPTLRGER